MLLLQAFLLLLLFIFQTRSDDVTKTCGNATGVAGPEINWQFSQNSGSGLPASVGLGDGESTDILRLSEFGFTSNDIPGSDT